MAKATFTWGEATDSRLIKGLLSRSHLRKDSSLLTKGRSKTPREHFISFYKSQGKKHITERANYFAKRLGLDPSTVRILDLKKRWASRSEKGINFHWKVMLAPATVIDYIVVHELAHFKQSNHSPKFWEIVESILPNYVEKKEWLRLNGANLDI